MVQWWIMLIATILALLVGAVAGFLSPVISLTVP